ncbi:MAG: hypothetical protein C5B59_06640 [Bacteroidetes bacterium]|nr:MAG: hypothetical protein C5B59_06640 [Bacteroidota bacterium]
MEPLNPPVIVGEAVAGEAAKVRKQIKEIIAGVNKSQFTLAKLLHKVKTGKLYNEDTFASYIKTLDLKTTKAYYLVRIVESMQLAGVPEEVYEPVGIAKLRVITKIEPTEEYQGKPGTAYIKAMTETAKEVEMDTLKEAVDHLQGKTGDNAIVWLNVALNKSARDNVVNPAIELAKKNLGTVAQDAEGNAVDSSDGRCLEIICAAFLADTQNTGGEQ